jgi:hypothetical protein
MPKSNCSFHLQTAESDMTLVARIAFAAFVFWFDTADYASRFVQE